MLRLLALVGALCLAWLVPHRVSAAEKAQWKIVATTYPAYVFTHSVIVGEKGIALELLLPASLGCPHDYSLTPRDVRKLADADVLVVNGLGMEEFLGAPVEQAHPRLPIIDSSGGVKATLQYSEDDGGNREEHQHGARHAHAEQSAHVPGEHERHGLNPHHFASPRVAARVVMHIADELSKLRPQSRRPFTDNAAKAAVRLNALADEFSRTVKKLKNKRVVTQHGAFDYLARDAGLEIVATVQAHPGQDLSAAQVMTLVKLVKQRGAGAIFAEPQYPDRIVRTIAREAGVPAATLDPVASGPERAGLDHYEAAMRTNMRTLENTLGAQQ